jgi:energy-converting hydrogenase A subunit M
MELIIYPLLARKSQKAMRRTRKKFGHSYFYEPRRNLVYRLSKELNLSLDEVRLRISEERAFILKYPQYFA